MKTAKPEQILEDGQDFGMITNPYTGEASRARKGTIAALIANVCLVNEFVKGQKDSLSELEELIDVLDSLLDGVKVAGVFDLFSVRDWLCDTRQPGKFLVGVLYLNKYISSRTEDLISMIENNVSVIENSALQKMILEFLVSIKG